MNRITEISDIALQKLFEEKQRFCNFDIREAIIDKDWNLLDADMRKDKLNLSTEQGLIFIDKKIYMPRTPREWILQVVHGDHESVLKMRLLAKRVYWLSKEKDLNQKANQFITCFRSGKILNSVIFGNEVNRLPKFRD